MIQVTEKVEKVFSNINGNLNHKKMNVDGYLQHNMQRPSAINITRKKFERDYKVKDFKYVMRKYGRESFPRHCARVIKMCARKLLGKRGLQTVKKVLGRGL